MQTETVFLDFREFPFFLFAFIAGIMLVDSHFAAFSLYPQRLFYSADIGGSDAFVRIQDISPCSHIVKQSAARKSDEIAPHPSAFNFFSCRKFFPHIEMGFGIVYEILTLSDLPARGGLRRGADVSSGRRGGRAHAHLHRGRRHPALRRERTASARALPPLSARLHACGSADASGGREAPLTAVLCGAASALPSFRVPSAARGGRGRSVVGVRPLLRPVCGHCTRRRFSAAQRVARGSAVCARAAARGSILTALSRLRHGHLSMQKPRDLRGAFYAATHILCVTCSVRGWS